MHYIGRRRRPSVTEHAQIGRFKSVHKSIIIIRVV